MHKIGLVAVSSDPASQKIRSELLRMGYCGDFFEVNNFLYVRQEDEIVKDLHSCDAVIVLSKHKSASQIPCLTAHYPGNVSTADYGGMNETLSVGCGSLFKRYLQFLAQAAEGNDISLVAEQDHHGPTLDIPTLYVEIGSSEQQWNNSEYAEMVARAVKLTIDHFASNPFGKETFIAIGNTHYPKKFTDMMVKEEYSFSHIFSKHAAEKLTSSILEQALNKSLERVIGVVLDWKTLKQPIRNNIIKFADEKSLEIIRV